MRKAFIDEVRRIIKQKVPLELTNIPWPHALNVVALPHGASSAVLVSVRAAFPVLCTEIAHWRAHHIHAYTVLKLPAEAFKNVLDL